MKRYMAILGSFMFCVVCFSLYLMLESTAGISSSQNVDVGENDLSSIEAKIKRIESDLQRNHKTINLIKDTVRDIANGDTQSLTRLQKALSEQGSDLFLPGEHKGGNINQHGAKTVYNISKGNKAAAVVIAGEMCGLGDIGSSKPDVNMLDVLTKLPFDNIDGGVWKQGYPISYSESIFAEKPLKVFVIPHSHNDPGWLKTFERYYTEQTRNILNLMVDKLEAFPEMRFIYAEMSFFNLWWNEISPEKKERTIRLLKEKRLEITTGGWVMSDEANAHYFAMIDQLIEGNQWLHNQLGFKPRSGWAIDPFGHTPTMAYILKEAGFENMLIQRTHYAIKKHLAQTKGLEFLWRQGWDHSGKTEILCHMMPFYSYDVPHTCGPDPKVCCQFDFKRLPGGRITCPWKIAPVAITEANIEDRARTILDQWRKKSTLYKNNVALAPLGDDFRYDKASEWDQQYTNYKKLFDYMNARKDWNVQAQFGTLSDYFDALRERSGSGPGKAPKDYPTLSGDFFSYADRDDHYWSGYYTSRPFYKRLDRVLEHHLRGAEVAYSLAVAYVKKHGVTAFPTSVFMKHLVSARRGLGLFQHHDGITGTAKDFVVVDYGHKLLRSVMDMKEVMRQSASLLLTKDKASYQHRGDNPFIDIDDIRGSHDSLPVRTVMVLTDELRPVVLYNSLAQNRLALVYLHVDTPYVELRDPEGKIVPTQVLPLWTSKESMSDQTFRVVFNAQVPAMGLSRYMISRVNKDGNNMNTLSRVTFYGGTTSSSHFVIDEKPKGEDFSIENAELRADFTGNDAMLSTITLKQTGEKINTNVHFVVYGTRNQRDKSGAYLFLPGGAAQPLHSQTVQIRVHRGPLLHEVNIILQHVNHIVSLKTSPGVDGQSLEILNLVDVRHENNYELVMRVNTDIQNSDGTFYTDLNGFQMMQRKSFDKLTLQGNFYPMAAMAYLEDKKHRFTILTGQSLGVASLKQGQLEIVQDRTLGQDDNRGLGQGVQDNKPTPNIFRFLPETKKQSPESNSGLPSLTAVVSSREFSHPVVVFPATQAPAPPSSSELLSKFQPLNSQLHCEMHLLNLRAMQRDESDASLQFVPLDTTALLLHHTPFDCSIPSRGPTCSMNKGEVKLHSMFKGILLKNAQSTSLTLLHDGNVVAENEPVTVPPMEIKAYKVKLG